ncbi:MAG: polyprenyl synthetase family protein [Planctomycetaceae bacterium]
MSTADHTAADSPAPRGDAAGRMTIPLAILPAPVPPALIRSRPPHPSIPQTKPQRTALLEAIRRGLHERPAVPPLRMEELRERARAALAEVGLPETHLDYAGVLVNNESWRDALAAVPFERRLLLMPKCLRVESRCPAPFDEFGLLCKSCGLCSIQDFQAEAERLGYAVLVAEGSALVMAMIQTGQIEAIVGVSCLPVLEKTHPFVEAAAIPAVAVPLLQDDCIDTMVDDDWVWDYIHLESSDASRRLDLGGLRDRVAGWFEPAALEGLLGPAEGHAERVARDWLALAGKRWRPFLAAAVHGALVPAPSEAEEAVLRTVAVAVECFHKASLVHDDIEDGDLERYGEPTLPGALGVPVALNAGDVLIGEGYRLLAEAGLPAEAAARAVGEAARSQRLLCRGQGEELAWSRAPVTLASRQVLEIFRLKTAPAFDVALQLGAIAAGASGEGMADVLRGFSEAVGIAYQIKDDLEDLQDDAGLLPGAQPRPSIVLALGAERARNADRDLLARLSRGEHVAGATAEGVRLAISACKADEKATLLLEAYKEQAVRALDGLGSATLKGLLRRVLGKIFDDLAFEGFCREAEQERLRASGGAPQAQDATPADGRG